MMSIALRHLPGSPLSRAPLSLAALLLCVVPGLDAAAQTQTDGGTAVQRAVRSGPGDAGQFEGVRFGAGRFDGVRDSRRLGGRFFRPLRTFRGQPVTVGSGTSSDLSIGVVRAIRADGRESVGVVRAFRGGVVDNGFGGFGSPFLRLPTPPVEQGGLIVNRGGAASAAPAGPASEAYPQKAVPGVASGGSESAPLQVYAGQPRPVAAGANPWDLLNQGRYRAAGERFDEQGDDAQRTGAALAAALSGDVKTAVALMPARPVLPEGFSLNEATLLRLRQVRSVFFEDNPTMRSALAAVLSARE